MSSVAIVFRKDKLNKKNEAPIHFRIIKDRKSSYISAQVMLHVKHWDVIKNRVKKTYPNSARLNSLLLTKLNELQNGLFESETQTKSLSSHQLKDRLFGKRPSDFFAFAEDVIDQYIKSGKIGTYDRSRSTIAKLRGYQYAKQLTFLDITPVFLMKYERYLRDELKNSTNTIHKDMKFIRKIFNDAYRLDIIEHNQNPFLKYQLKLEKTQRMYLTEDELQLIEKCRLAANTRLALHRDMFVFASYAGGLRISDLLRLQLKNFDGSHIIFTTKKTGQQLSINLPQKALEIIKRYMPTNPSPNNFIFPILSKDLNLENPREVDRKVSGATAYINKNLKIIAKKAGIEKNVSFHVSRHTWATRAIAKDIPLEYVMKLMGHANMRETLIYARIMGKQLDKAMEAFND